MLYYKITDENLGSMAISRHSNLFVQYKLNEFVYANPEALKYGYGLLVFDSFESLRKFACINVDVLNDRFFECEIDSPMTLAHHIFDPHGLNLQSYSENLDFINSKSDYSRFPIGSVMAKGVKLLREIEYYER